MACDINTLLSEAKCFSCLDEKSQLAVIATLLCGIAEAGGGGGGGVQYFAGSGPPTTQTPANGAGAYYDYTNKATYNWNPTLNGGAGGFE